jgi:hypothetical protein
LLRLTFDQIYNILTSNKKYGITTLPGYGEVIVYVKTYRPPATGHLDEGVAELIVYTPSGDVELVIPFKNMSGWIEYKGPIPPHFGHQGGLPGGMGGQGYGQGQTFPSPWGGQGSPGGWGTWGY